MYSRNCNSLGAYPGEGEQTESPGWLQLGVTVLDAWNKFTGGDSSGVGCWSGYSNHPFLEPCPDTPNYDAVARAVARASDADITKLIYYLTAANSGKGPKTREALARTECIPFWTKAILGGKGCVASKFPEAPDWFRDFVFRWGAPTTAEEAEPGSALPSGLVGSTGLALLAAGVALFAIPRILNR